MSVNLVVSVVRKIGPARTHYRNCANQTITNWNKQQRLRRIHLGTTRMAEGGPPAAAGSNDKSSKSKLNSLKSMTDEDWAKKLTADQYFVTREHGTEAPFTGKYYNHTQDGIYNCVCCGSVLFSSKTKYDSGSGWPSFSDVLAEAEGEVNVLKRTDMSNGMVRTECICKNCNAHLGHVFDDGPTETCQRYCINSAALKFEPKKV